MTEANSNTKTQVYAEKFITWALHKQPQEHPLTDLLLRMGSERLAHEVKAHPENFRLSKQERTDQGLPTPNIQQTANSIDLPSLPEVAIQLQRVTADPKSSANDVAKVIQLDPSLSAILLHLVNSAFYGFPQKIDTIDRAVAIVGTTQLHALALGRMVLSMASTMPPKWFNMDMYWEHSIACGVIGREIASLLRLESPERHFLAGLLHDIGKPALAAALPEHAQALQGMLQTHISWQAEQEILGFDHARFGSMVLRKWDIPYSIVEAVACHHKPQKTQHPVNTQVLHIANIIAQAIIIPSANISPITPLDTESWDALGLEAEQLGDALCGIEDTMAAMVRILIG